MTRKVHLHSSLPADAARGWNFQSSKALLTLRCDSQSRITNLHSPAGIIRQWNDPLLALDWMSSHIRGEQGARWIGYLNYELGRLFEQIPSVAVDDLCLPLFHFSLHETSGGPVGSSDRPSPAPPESGSSGHRTDPPGVPAARGLKSTLSRSQYVDRVAQVIGFIQAGDVFQVNLSQRFSTGMAIDSTQVWHRLIDRTPAAYGAFVDCDDHTIISNSPELFLQISADRRVVTRPIKGTRANLPGMQEQLQNSAKDHAELNMIIDLERNDLGRICRTGSVRVTQLRTIEAHPTVYHGVATIEGTLRDEVTFVDLLYATFPGGSVTGAPKIRAMQIIEELEPVRRGPYCGAIGYLSSDGSMQFNVAIRTMIIKDGLAHIPVGGGIVADSDPIQEYDETIVKARAMFDALNLQPDSLISTTAPALDAKMQPCSSKKF